MELISKSLFRKFFVVTGIILSLSTTSFAGIIRVTTNSPSGPGSITEAITTANLDATMDTVLLEIRNTIVLSSPLTITNPVAVICYSKSNVVLDGSVSGTVFSIAPSCNGDVWFEGLNFTNGSTGGNGVIHVSGNNQSMFRLTVYDCIFEYCRATNGGAINFNGTHLRVHTCSFTHCSASNNGGSIFLNTSGGSSSIIFNSSFGRRFATSPYDEAINGGGVYIQNGPAKVVNNTFARMEVQSQGGGLFSNTSNYELKNNIFYQNFPANQFRDLAGSVPTTRGFNCFQQAPGAYANGPSDINGGAWNSWITGNSTLYLSPLTKGHSGLLVNEFAPIIDNGDNTNIDSDFYWSLGINRRSDIRSAPRMMQGSFFSNVTIDRGSVEYSPFCVTNANNAGPGSLTVIVDSVNNTVRPGPYYIWFDISASGPHLVNNQASLQLTKNQTIIDGFSVRGAREAGFYAEPEIMFQISGNNVSTVGLHLMGSYQEIYGLHFSDYTTDGIRVNNGANECVVKGNIISNCSGNGIRIEGVGIIIGGIKYNERNYIHNNVGNAVHISASYNYVQGNYIGIRPDLSAGGNGGGVLVDDGSSNEIGSLNPLGGNLISANTNFGIKTESNNAYYVNARNNILGCHPNLTSHSGYANGIGIHLNDSYYNYIGDEMYPFGGNVIVSSVNQGVLITGSEGQQLSGNIIGLYPDGVTNGYVGGAGIEISGYTDYNIIGSYWQGNGGNVISNCVYGVYSHATSGYSSDILKNKIGTDVSGTIVKGNQKSGIYVSGAFNNNTQAYISENLIVGHQNLGFGYGIHGENASISAYNNFIGLDSNDNAMPNRVGIYVENTQGGFSSIADNTIAYSQGIGIWVKNSNAINIDYCTIRNNQQEGVYIEDNTTSIYFSSNTVYDNGSTGLKVTNDCDSLVFRENIIHSNGAGMDYDLGNTGPDGYTLNQGIPVPVLSSASYCASELNLNGYFGFPAYPNEEVIIEFYLVPAGQANSFNRGGSHEILGSSYYNLDGSGEVYFNFQSEVAMSAGDLVVAVASLVDPNFGEGVVFSSEFSENIVVTSGISITASHSNASCSNLFDGSASATVIGSANTPKWFEIGDLVNSIWVDFSVFNLGPGDYAVVIEDGGCTDTAFFTVTSPAPLNVGTVTTTDVQCAGTMTGQIQLMGANGGTFPFEYNLNGGPSSPSTIFTGLVAGAYTVGVIDANGCSDSVMVNIMEPTFLVSSSSPSDLSCFESNDGSISTFPSGGVPPYTYNWTGPDFFSSPNQNVFGLAAGMYTLEVNDMNGCIYTDYITLSQPSQLNVGFTMSNFTPCAGESILFTNLSDPGASSYFWDFGNGDFTNNTLENTSSIYSVAGSYNVKLTVTYGACSDSAEQLITVNQVPYLTGANSLSICSGESVNTTLVADLPSSFSWYAFDNPFVTGETVSPQSTAAINDVLNNTNSSPEMVEYIVTSFTAQCSNSGQSFYVYVNPLPEIIASNDTAICESNTVSLFANGALNYSWSPSVGLSNPNVFNPIASPSATTSYTVLGEDGNGCTNTNSVTIIVNALPVVTASNNGPLCEGEVLNLFGSFVPGATYTWTGPSYNANSQNANLINANPTNSGTYTLSVIDANGCENFVNTNVTINLLPFITASYFGPVCEGALLQLEAVEGGLSYTWTGPNGFFSTEQYPEVSWSADASLIGNYDLEATDGVCVNFSSVFVEVNELPVQLSAPTANDADCGVSNGSLIGFDASGAPNLFYAWYDISLSNVGTGQDLYNQPAGDYTVEVLDGVGCSYTFGPFTIVNPNAPLPPDIAGNPTQGCEGELIMFMATSLSPSPTFSWSGPNGNSSVDADLEITSLTLADAGTYSVTVTSANCISAPSTIVFNVVSPETPTFSFGTFQEYCEGDVTPILDNTSLENISGNWSPTVVSNTISGTYNFTPNSNECAFTTIFEVVINSPLQPTFSFGTSDSICFGGIGQNLVTSSTENINGLWSPSTVDNQASGIYTFTPNVGECATQTTLEVTVLDQIALSITDTQPSCTGDSDGVITISILSGGFTPFIYSIDGGVTNQTVDVFSGLAAGSYSIWVEDAFGCSASDLYSLTDPAQFSLIISANEPTCFGNADGEFSFGYSGGSSTVFTYQIDGGSVTSLSTNPTVIGGFEGGGSISVILTNEFGCAEMGSHTFTDPSPLAFTLNSISDTCNRSVGTIQVTNIAGGSAPYTYILDGVSYTNPTISSIAGSHPVTVEDANGCQITENVSVFNIDVPITITFGDTYATCPDQPIEIVATGGEEFVWTGPNITGNTLANPMVNPSVDTWYQVVANWGSCYAADSVLVSINSDCDIIDLVITTNAFSPNGDGINDNLVFDVANLLNSYSNTVVILNRWGDVIREFIDYNNVDVVWDGTGNSGVLMPAGTYFYLLEIPAIDFKSSGWIQLIR
jgi:gliding motility-associated-like protein